MREVRVAPAILEGRFVRPQPGRHGGGSGQPPILAHIALRESGVEGEDPGGKRVEITGRADIAAACRVVPEDGAARASGMKRRDPAAGADGRKPRVRVGGEHPFDDCGGFEPRRADCIPAVPGDRPVRSDRSAGRIGETRDALGLSVDPFHPAIVDDAVPPRMGPGGDAEMAGEGVRRSMVDQGVRKESPPLKETAEAAAERMPVMREQVRAELVDDQENGQPRPLRRDGRRRGARSGGACEPAQQDRRHPTQQGAHSPHKDAVRDRSAVAVPPFDQSGR